MGAQRRQLDLAIKQVSRYPRIIYASAASDFSFVAIVSRSEDLVVYGRVRVRSVTPYPRCSIASCNRYFRIMTMCSAKWKRSMVQ